MIKHQNIPLIHGSVLGPVIELAQSIGVPIENVIHKVNLQPEIIDNTNIFIPEIPARRVVNIIKESENIPLISVKALSMFPIYDWEIMKPITLGSKNLIQLLSNFCNIVPTISSISNFSITEQKDLLWVQYTGISFKKDTIQIELFQLMLVLQLVQWVLGKNWRPETIHFKSSYSSHIYNCEILNPSKIMFSKNIHGFSIPKHYLPIEIPTYRINKSIELIKGLNAPSQDIAISLFNAIKPYIGKVTIQQKLITDITGMSIRSLQRKLALNGNSYSEIIDLARYDKAKKLLLQSKEKLVDISLLLGYECSSSFTRAFKRWAGITPSEYRYYNKNNKVNYDS